MSKKQNDITRYVNFTDYKEPVNLDYGWSSISSFVTLVVIGFFAFYLIFGVTDPIEVFDMLVGRIQKFASLTSTMGKVWNELCSMADAHTFSLNFDGIEYEYSMEWSDHFLRLPDIIELLFPNKVG